MISRVQAWLRAAFMRSRLEREMQEEMAHHLAEATTLLMARGLSREEARRQALREFGNLAWLQEESRNVRSTWIEGVVADCRFALRQFRRNRATCFALLSVLALGISIAVGLFSTAHSFANQPPRGIRLESDLVRIRGISTLGNSRFGRRLSRSELEGYRGLPELFTRVAGWTNVPVTLDAGGELEGLPARAVLVTEDYFSTIGVKPLLGPGFHEGSPSEPVAVIAHAAWDRLYGRASNVIGRRILLNGIAFTVTGVAPRYFKGIDGYAGDDLIVWIPVASQGLLTAHVAPEEEIFGAVARLAPGISHESATAAVGAVAARTASRMVTDYPIPGLRRVPGEAIERIPDTDVVPLLSQSGTPNFEKDAAVLYAAVGVLGTLVLLVTCTNVSALLTGLALARRKEIGARLSLGAPRSRLIRQLVTESVLLTFAAASIALALTWLLAKATYVFIPELEFPIRVDPAAAFFTFAVALGVGVLFGLSPALHATRIAIGDALKDSSTTVAAMRARLQRGLVVLQVAFTQPLIVGLVAMLFIVMGDLARGTPTVAADRVLSLEVQSTTIDASRANSDPAIEQRVRNEMTALQQRLLATAGVATVVPAYSMVRGYGGVELHPDDSVHGGFSGTIELAGPVVAPGHFTVLGVRIPRGRDFESGDAFPEGVGPKQIPIILGSVAAESYWPGADPIGRRLRTKTTGRPDGDPIHFVVVGISEQQKSKAFVGGIPMSGEDVYFPAEAEGPLPVSLLIGTKGVAAPLGPAIRQIVREVAPDMAVRSLRSVADIQREARAQFRLVTGGLAAAAVLTFFLSGMGLYSVVRFAAEQRAGEVAVRLAVGAHSRQIMGLFVSDGLRLSAAGLSFGLPISLVALHIMASTTPGFGTIPLLPVGLIAGFGILFVGVAATWLPASRAADVHAAAILRRA